jgi:hypothetical protein
VIAAHAFSTSTHEPGFWQAVETLADALEGGRSLRGLELLEAFLREHREPAASDFERRAVRRLLLTIALNAGGRP